MIETNQIGFEEIKDYVFAAFTSDENLKNYYDKSFNMGNFIGSNDVFIQDILHKIKEHIGAKMYSVNINKQKAGYFVSDFDGNLLISFGLIPKFRGIYSDDFFKEITKKLSKNFFCYLYAYNYNGIGWLVKNGMKKTAENITILSF